MYPGFKNLPVWQCHKVVRAVKIGRIENVNGEHVITPQDSNVFSFTVSPEYIKKHQPAAGGYFVLYEDEYESYSPARAFERGYTRI